jgi:uncharacterized protein (TIGR02996 family)
VSTTPTDSPFIQAILAAPEDAAPLLIFADWLEEQGQPDLAYACRWMGYRGCRPGQRRRPRLRKPWAWWNPSSAEHEMDPEDLKDIVTCPHARLPGLVFRAMSGEWAPHAYYFTWLQAADDLAFGLRNLRDLISLDGPRLTAGDDAAQLNVPPRPR